MHHRQHQPHLQPALDHHVHRMQRNARQAGLRQAIGGETHRLQPIEHQVMHGEKHRQQNDRPPVQIHQQQGQRDEHAEVKLDHAGRELDVQHHLQGQRQRKPHAPPQPPARQLKPRQPRHTGRSHQQQSRGRAQRRQRPRQGQRHAGRGIGGKRDQQEHVAHAALRIQRGRGGSRAKRGVLFAGGQRALLLRRGGGGRDCGGSGGEGCLLKGKCRLPDRPTRPRHAATTFPLPPPAPDETRSASRRCARETPWRNSPRWKNPSRPQSRPR